MGKPFFMYIVRKFFAVTAAGHKIEADTKYTLQNANKKGKNISL